MTEVIPGFSLTNRWLLYTSLMLAPAQAISGIGDNCPTNVGFLAYNWYNQYVWYAAIRKKELHALSLLPVHFNFVYVFTYLGGITSGNIFVGIMLGFATAGLIILNCAAAWTSWATNLPEGYGVYHFFFFGWRTLSPAVIFAISLPIIHPQPDLPWWSRYPAIIWGPAATLFFAWPIVLWTELIISRNHIKSQTDMIAVYLFVAQVVTMLIPPGCDVIMSHAFSPCRRSHVLLPSFTRPSTTPDHPLAPLGHVPETA